MGGSSLRVGASDCGVSVDTVDHIRGAWPESLDICDFANVTAFQNC